MSDIFHQVMDYSDAEIKKFSVPSLLTRTTNDLTQLQIMIVIWCGHYPCKSSTSAH